jgi:PAS domain S-box-containing protein
LTANSLFFRRGLRYAATIGSFLFVRESEMIMRFFQRPDQTQVRPPVLVGVTGLSCLPMAAWASPLVPDGARVLAVFVLGILATLLLPFLYESRGRRTVAAKRSIGNELWMGKFWEALEQNPTSIVITDTDGRIEYVNAKFLETFGYSRDEVIGQNPRLVSSGSTSPELYRDLWATISADRSWQSDLKNLRRDDSVLWERVLISPIQDRMGM